MSVYALLVWGETGGLINGWNIYDISRKMPLWLQEFCLAFFTLPYLTSSGGCHGFGEWGLYCRDVLQGDGSETRGHPEVNMAADSGVSLNQLGSAGPNILFFTETYHQEVEQVFAV